MNILTSFFRRAGRRHTYSDLSRLDDHLLRDIGLSRADLHRMMSGGRSSRAKGSGAHE